MNSLKTFLLKYYPGALLFLLLLPVYSQAQNQSLSSASSPVNPLDREVDADPANPCLGPAYPPESLAANESGTTVLNLRVGPAGIVEASDIEASSGYERLDKAAQQASLKCKFKAAIVDGKPATAWIKTPVPWLLPVKIAGAGVTACIPPEYPEYSLRNKQEGVTELSLLVGLDGSVIDSKVKKSSGFKRLDDAARNSLEKCKFKPVIVDGKPDWINQKFTWSLSNPSAILVYDENKRPFISDVASPRSSNEIKNLQNNRELMLQGISRSIN